MCGIAGTYNWGNRQVLAAMNQLQFHRGPNDGGVWDRLLPDGRYLGLASRRLAILDLSPAGHMPMGSADGKLWITYNGESYNYRELRQDREARGEVFRSHTDTEVVLRRSQLDGPQSVNRLEGMFAFC